MFLNAPKQSAMEKLGSEAMCMNVSIEAGPTISVAGQQALLVQMAVAEVTGVEFSRICSAGRGDRKAALARQTAMYLCHLVLHMNAAQIGLAFARDRKTVCHALMRIEELREDVEFDRAMSWLEASLCRAGDRA